MAGRPRFEALDHIVRSVLDRQVDSHARFQFSSIAEPW
jgi:hypothetical protein